MINIAHRVMTIGKTRPANIRIIISSQKSPTLLFFVSGYVLFLIFDGFLFSISSICWTMISSIFRNHIFHRNICLLPSSGNVSILGFSANHETFLRYLKLCSSLHIQVKLVVFSKQLWKNMFTCISTKLRRSHCRNELDSIASRIASEAETSTLSSVNVYWRRCSNI